MQLALEELTLRRGDAFVSYTPPGASGDLDQLLSAGLDMQASAPVIGRQWFSHSLLHDRPFYLELAAARAFLTSQVCCPSRGLIAQNLLAHWFLHSLLHDWPLYLKLAPARASLHMRLSSAGLLHVPQWRRQLPVSNARVRSVCTCQAALDPALCAEGAGAAQAGLPAGGRREHTPHSPGRHLVRPRPGALDGTRPGAGALQRHEPAGEACSSSKGSGA